MKKALLFISCALLISNGFAQKNKNNAESGFITCDEFHITKPLSEIFAANPVDESKLFKKEESEDRENRKAQKFRKTVEKDGPAYGNDPNDVQRGMGTSPGHAPIQNWAGQTASGFYPLDPSGAAGTNNYVQMINATTFRVWSKTGTLQLTGTLGALWSPATPDDGDPIVLYDKAADRWLLAQFGQTGNKIYIAISQTSNPTGAYYTYTFTSAQFPDYLKFSVWQDGYYMTSNQSTQKVFAFERTQMLLGNAASRAVYQTFNPPHIGSSFFVPLPGDTGDGTMAATGTPCPIFSYSDNGWGGAYVDAVNISSATVNWVPATPTMTISSNTSVPATAFDASYNSSWNDISQPGTTQKLDGIGGTLMYRAQYKIFSGYNSVVLSWGVKISSTQRSIKWCEMRQTGGVWSIYQQGIYAPDTDNRWMSSIAMDDNGAIGLCYMKDNSTSTYPSLYYCGRRSCDPLGTLPIAETLAKAGTASQTGVNRDGDYAETWLDPDGLTFWHCGMYMGAGGSQQTQIYSFQLATCSTNAGVAIALTAGTNPMCSGASATFTATPTNGGTLPAYQWKVNGVNVGTNSATYTTTTLTTGQIVTCVMTSNLGGVTNNPATSNAITMVVNPVLVPAVSIALTTGTNPECSGASATFTATPTNGGTPTYQWKVNGVNAGTNSTTFTTTTLTNGQIVTCVMTSNATCASPTTATSNAITMVVNPTVTPSVVIALTTGTNPMCAGASATFTATPTNGGTPAYQWKVNGVNAGTNSTTFTTTTLTTGQIVTCVMTTTAACPTSTTATSNAITMVVNPILTPSVVIAQTTGTNPECAGASATFTATPTNGGTPSYQWKVNGVNVGTNSPTYTTTTLTNGQIVTCVMTTTVTCPSAATATSNAITMVVSASVTPSVSIALTTGTNPECAGASATFVATAVNGGTTPAYQWKVNGVNAGTNSATFTTTTLTNGQIVTCVMTSTAGCVSQPTATSNAITMVVNATPATPVATSNSAICAGTTLTLATNTVASASYAWIGPSAYTSALQNPTRPNSTVAMSGTYSVTVTVAGCTSPAGTVAVVVNAIPAITNSTFTQTICSGSTATITPTSSIANTTFNYTASTSGSITGFNASGTGNISNVLVNTGATAGTVIYIITPVGPATSLCQGAPTTFIVTVNPSPTVTVNSTSICSGQTAALTANGATTYTWSAGAVSTGVNTAGASPTTTTTYTVTGTSAGCTNTAIATVTVNTSPLVTVNSTAICAGQTVVLIANGATSYTWSAGATSTGVNTASVTPSVTTSYTVTGTSAGCTGSAVSTITVTPLPIITVNSTSICQGQTATLVASGGSSYVWSTGATSTGVNSATASPLVTTTYTVSGTTAGCTGSATSIVTVTATPPTPTITQNGAVLTSSSPTGNQWYLNGLLITGATGVTYTATQSGNYSVIVSNNGCYSLSSADAVVVMTGIADVSATNFIDIYPNPNYGVFTVMSTKYKVQSIKVMDVLGQVVFQSAVVNQQSTIDISNEASGIYFVEIKTNGFTIVKKVNVIK